MRERFWCVYNDGMHNNHFTNYRPTKAKIAAVQAKIDECRKDGMSDMEIGVVLGHLAAATQTYGATLTDLAACNRAEA